MKTNSRHFSLAFALVAAVLVLCSCAAKVYPKGYGQTEADKVITAKAQKALANDGLYDYRDVEISTINGTTELKGTADSWQAISHAEELVRYVPGVKQVDNKLSLKQ